MAEVLISSEGSCHSGSCPMVFRYHTESGELHHAPEMEDLLPGLDNGAIIGFLDLTGDGKEDHLFGFTHTLAAIQGEKNTYKERIEIPVPEGYPFDDFRDTGALALADLDENGLIDIVEGDSTCQGEARITRLPCRSPPGGLKRRVPVFSEPVLPLGRMRSWQRLLDPRGNF